MTYNNINKPKYKQKKTTNNNNNNTNDNKTNDNITTKGTKAIKQLLSWRPALLSYGRVSNNTHEFIHGSTHARGASVTGAQCND